MTRGWGRALLVAVAVLATLPLVTATAGPAGAADRPHIAVVTETPWVAPDGTFLLTAAVADAPTGARVGITLHTQAVADRNAFARSLFGVDLGEKTLQIPSIDLDAVAPDADGHRQVTVAIALKQRLAGPALPGQRGVPLGLAGAGAYPLELKLFDADDQELTKIVTHLVRLPDPDEPATPLRAAVLLGIHAAPTVSAHGVDQATPATFRSATAIAAALADQPDVPITLDPTPETIEALNRSSDASRATLADLADHLAGRQVLDGPYVDLPFTAWISSGLGGDLLDQERARGNRILGKLLAPVPDGSTWVAQSDLTTEGAARLWQLGVRHLVVRPEALAPSTAVTADATLARPFQVATPPEAPMSAVAVDTGLQAAFNRQDDPQLAAYQVLAELSVIEQEAPASTRGVVLAAPADWKASTPFLTTLLAGLADHPLLRPVTVADLFNDVRPLQAGSTGDGATVVRALKPSLPPTDIDGYPAAVGALRTTVASYSTMVEADDPVLAQWDQRILLSGSVDLSPAARLSYLAVIRAFIARQVAAIDAPARQTVTLTAREGSIPLTLRSGLGKPVKVVLALESSSRLELPRGDRIAITLAPGAKQIPLRVRTRSPGDTPLTVRVLSPDGGLDLTGTQITVRSTAVSGIGYVLSVGAVLFLLVWWARHWRRARRALRREKSAVPE